MVNPWSDFVSEDQLHSRGGAEIHPEARRLQYCLVSPRLACCSPRLRVSDFLLKYNYGTIRRGSSFAAHSPELKSVKSTFPFHGIAFITNGALAVNPLGSYGLKTAISRPWS